MTIHLGTSPIAWSNEDLPELGRETPLEVCLREARQAGFDGIELGSKFPRSAEILRPILETHGLHLISGWHGGRLRDHGAGEEIAALDDHLDLMVDMGCPVMVFAEIAGAVHDRRGVPIADRPTLAEADWAPFCDRLTTIADHMAERGVRMAYHHHMGTVVQTAAEIDRLMADTGWSVGLLLDTGHLAYAGADPVAVARRHADRIVHVHAKDVRGAVAQAARGGRGSFLDAVVDGVFTVPGDGSLDFKAVLEPLRAVGYEGWLVVEAEQDPAKADPLTYATKGHRTLVEIVRQLGFPLANAA